MTYILAIFRSRAQAVDCNIRLKAMGIACELTNTPKEANIGCGLSVKLTPEAYRRAKAVIKGGYSAFYGFYHLQTTYGRITIGRI